MFSKNASIVLLLCPSFLSLVFIFTAVLHIFELGKSKTRIKKVSQSIPLIKKLNLKGYVDKCEYHRNVANRIRRFYLIYLLVLVVGLVVFVLSSFIAPLMKVANHFGFFKFLILDIPFIVFSVFCTKHDQRHGGVTWIWKAE